MGISVHQDIPLVLEKTVERIGQVSGDLAHERFPQRRTAAGQVDSPRGKFHDEQQVVRDQTTLRPHLDRREIDCCQHVPVRFDEGRPCGQSFSIRRRFDPVLLENVANGRVGNVIANVGQGTLDSVVTLGRILLRKAKDQVDNDLADSRPVHRFAALAVIPFRGHEHSMPAQDPVWREQRSDFFEPFASEDLTFDGQPSPLIIVEQNSLLAELLYKHLVFGSQVLDCLLLLPIDPRCQDQNQELPWL